MLCHFRTNSLLALFFCIALTLGCGSNSPAAGDGRGGGDGGGGGGGSCAELNQSGPWMWANPTPQGAPINRVRYVSETTAFAITAGGLVLKSCDAGETWQTVYKVYQVQDVAHGGLFGMHFFDENEGWVVGSVGQVSHTNDGGATWSNKSVATSHNINDVYFHDRDNGFIVGARGQFFSTSDAGNTWTAVTSPIGVRHLNAITFASPLIGWVGGEDGVVLYTDDGGSTWTELAIIVNEDISVARAMGADQVTFGTRGGRLFISRSPGLWLVLLLKGFINDFNFTDVNNGWVLYYDGSSYIGTRTEGVWDHVALPTEQTSRSLDFNGSNGILAGWWGYMMRSEDNGTNWHHVFDQVDVPDVYGVQLYDISFSPDGITGIAVGTDGVILRSGDAGVTWQPRTSGTSETLLGSSITSGGVAIVVGENATTLRSTDGGMTWATVTTQVTTPLTIPHYRSVSMWDDDSGIIVGAVTNGEETILSTIDGGETWQKRSQGIIAGQNNVLLDVWALAGTDEAWIGSRNGAVFHSDDRGVTWEAQGADTPFPVIKIQFLTNMVGWGATTGGFIIRTTDGGVNWDVVASAAAFDDMSFGSELVGVGVSTVGQVYGTSDGGLTWQYQSAGWSGWSHVRTVWMSSATDGALAGTAAKIQYTRTAGKLPGLTPR